MLFTGIIGEPGSGKTCLMTALAYKEQLEGVPIIANYKLEFPHIFMAFEQLAELNTSLQQSLILMDELAIGADAYDFFLYHPRQLTKLVAQLRKRDCSVLYTVQRFQWIAKRLRDITNGFLLMVDTDITSENPVGKKHVCKGIFAVTSLNTDFETISESNLFDGSKYWHLYHTKEVVEGYAHAKN